MTLGPDWHRSSRSHADGNCLEARWRKSSYSFHEANCLEAAWHRSSRSQSNGHCTEAALRDGTILVRDSKLGAASPVLTFTPSEWQTFILAMKGGL